jgi:hypothetical protein
MVLIEYGWNGGSSFLNDEQKKTFRSLLSQLRKFGFKKRAWTSLVVYSTPDSELDFNKSIRVVSIVQQMITLMRIAEIAHRRISDKMGMMNCISLYGDVYICIPKLIGADVDYEAFSKINTMVRGE